MKTKLTKLITTTLCISLMTALSYTQHSKAQDNTQPVLGTEGGKGGGGLLVNGAPVTFGTAGFQFITNPDLEADEVPGLATLAKSLFDKPFFFSDKIRISLLSGVLPSADRAYKKIDNKTISPEVLQRIIQEYNRTTNLNINELALFAITDTNSKVTYLFDKYFQLSPIEQQAILFHEAVWLKVPKMTYEKVIQAEIGYQNYLESLTGKPLDPKKLYELVSVFSDNTSMLRFAVEMDLRTKVLDKYIKESNLLPYSFIYGENTIKCLEAERKDCEEELHNNLRLITMENPKSMLLRYMRDGIIGGRAALMRLSMVASWDKNISGYLVIYGFGPEYLFSNIRSSIFDFDSNYILSANKKNLLTLLSTNIEFTLGNKYEKLDSNGNCRYSMTEYRQAVYVGKNYSLKLELEQSDRSKAQLPAVAKNQVPVYETRTRQEVTYDPKDKKKKNPIIKNIVEQVQVGSKEEVVEISKLGFYSL